jgi:peptidoglycan hydrolase CwlO-like protein
MRYFLIYILGVLPFFAPAQVVLPDSVASFYLNRHFHADQLKKSNTLLIQLLDNKDKTIKAKDDLIGSLADDYKNHEAVIDTYKKETFILNEDIKDLNDKIKVEKTKTFACVLGIIILLLVR